METILVYVPGGKRRTFYSPREVIAIRFEIDKVTLELEDFDDWVSQQKERGFHPASSRPGDSFENWFAAIPESWKTNVVEMSLLEFVINVADHEDQELQLSFKP